MPSSGTAMAASVLKRMSQPRYVGTPSFLRLPVVLSDSLVDSPTIDIGLVGVPYDGGVTNRPGARHGPREVRNQSSLIRLRNQATGVCPYDLCTVADLGDVTLQRPFDGVVSAHEEIQSAFEAIIKRSIVPLAVGGDHSISLPILRALHKVRTASGDERPMAMVHIDAHCDTGDEYFGSKFHHGAPFSRAVEEGLIEPSKVVQIGIRGTLNEADQWGFSYDHGMRVVQIEEVQELGMAGVIELTRDLIGDAPTYFTFDIDALDPAFAPGTGTPEIGGLTSAEAQQLIRGFTGLNFVGADLVEVAPPFDTSTGLTAMTGANLLFEMLCVLAQSPALTADSSNISHH